MILFDAHVHIYDAFDLDVFFASACKNFSAAAKKIWNPEDHSFFLLLTESKNLNYFSMLHKKAREDGEPGVNRLALEVIEDNLSIGVTHLDFPDLQLIVAAGRQIVTVEGLELLALMTSAEFNDGMELEQAVKAVLDQGGFAVCPWGAGKWLGERGKILSNYMNKEKVIPFFLGDSGGRPSIWPSPELCKRPSFRGKIISGSDPLPLAGEESRVGSFGGCIEGACRADAPVASLMEQLLLPETKVQGYGHPLSLFAFLKGQLALRIR